MHPSHMGGKTLVVHVAKPHVLKDMEMYGKWGAKKGFYSSLGWFSLGDSVLKPVLNSILTSKNQLFSFEVKTGLKIQLKIIINYNKL
jgi:hypothetical protein